ncbi:MAG: hypothetical protein P4M11_03840 [Candidatus Pacebacteria bacterium]|nr:hypothetical protein [Candidatus Paceibacterota bacterium]
MRESGVRGLYGGVFPSIGIDFAVSETLRTMQQIVREERTSRRGLYRECSRMT